MGGLLAAKQATHIETDLGTLPVSGDAVEIRMNQAQIQTLRLLAPTVKPK